MDQILIILVAVAIAQLQYLIIKSTGMRRQSTAAKPVFVDTSALMDGRILTAAQTGFIPNNLAIPKSVVAELQLLADQADSDKRTRARHGLDIISGLRELPNVQVEIYNDDKLEGGVDERLVVLAKRSGGAICTIDFNLNKVAKANELQVLNLNELAQSIRMAFLPGESVSIPLQQKGQDSHQAVGYLADGTMVVVERAAKYIGQTVEIEFIRSLQTAAGRMMFAKLAKGDQEQDGSTGKTALSQKQNSRGRKPVVKAAKEQIDKKTDSPTDTASGEVKDEKKPRQQRTSSRRKRTNEDSLIDLVNSIDE